ncbi:GYD domain-containing protein [Falsiroseomonas sp.]|uniref:GYD domain-containing protein n=1 Tax=Falsiroseomonas sp. TaxID=2870721 RepID=UPI00356AAB3D
MPHFMLRWSFKDSTIKALTDKPQDREAAARQVVEAFGGKLVCYYFVLGEYDGLGICEFPDSISAAALSMRLGSTGVFSRVETHALLTTTEAQRAMQQVKDAGAGSYRPPGS